ncbi:hypothetical protein Kfla_5342 [Kribbella flavida DSM 17836]|uniref:Uncharacterized protein n=1 Tax=Kribbella flavida (strain DSM 17836 / JCM 10339 / NBRC 14399) TaxID=479435 RepID=D2PLA0_KRIFD|nr:hypothetical protein Kfla_5342 [Kribbella flavida DSM 17836]
MDLEFSADGWTARQIQGSRPDLAQWCAIWMGVALGLAFLAKQAELDALVKVLLIAAGVLLAIALLLVALEFVGTLIGVAWMTGSALTRGGRRKLRAEAKGIIDDLNEMSKAPETIQAVRVRSAHVRREPRGTAVELLLDDGSTRRYLRYRPGLVDAFRQLLGDRLSKV